MKTRVRRREAAEVCVVEVPHSLTEADDNRFGCKALDNKI